MLGCVCCFFFSSRRRHTRWTGDWSSDVCSSDLDEVEGEVLNRKLLPFGVKQIDFYEQAFRYGEAIWDRTGNPSHWAAYVLLAEWLLRDAGLEHMAANRRGPALLAPDTKVLNLSALVLDDPETPLADFERAHFRPNP